MQRSFLVALGAALLAAFALGGSLVPIAIAGNLLVSLRALPGRSSASTLAVMLVTQFGGEFGDALAVVVWARLRHRGSLARARRRAHPDRAGTGEGLARRASGRGVAAAQRLSAQLSAGMIDDARLTLARYPTTTPYERVRPGRGRLVPGLHRRQGRADRRGRCRGRRHRHRRRAAAGGGQSGADACARGSGPRPGSLSRAGGGPAAAGRPGGGPGRQPIRDAALDLPDGRRGRPDGRRPAGWPADRRLA